MKGVGNSTRVLEKAELLKSLGEYSGCIRTIESVPEEERSYRMTLLLGWAYSDLAVLGDKDSGRDEPDQELLGKAVSILESVGDQGKEDPTWNARMCYALWMTDGREADALEYAMIWKELDPNSEDARKQEVTIRRYIDENVDQNPEMYDEAQWDAVEDHIAEHFGDFPNVFHELVSPDIHVDICIIPPRRDHDYYTLVTMGMGAHEMDVPEEVDDVRRRAEVLINLPRDWRLDEESLQDNRWYWPIRMLKDVARLPVSTGCWLGWGHTVGMDEGERYDESTELCGCILLSPGVFGEDSYRCALPDGDEIEFFQVIPLYLEEIQHKIENDAETLLDVMNDDLLEVIDPLRLNVVTDFDRIDHDDAVMDDARRHQRIIDRLGLDTEKLAAYGHMSIYLEWCIRHGMMNGSFVSRHREVVQSVRSGEMTDLRGFIHDDPDMDGRLTTLHLNRIGSFFTQWYNWGDKSNPYEFLRDIKDYADTVFEGREWRDEEEMFNAYLLVPWSDEYRLRMMDTIDERFAQLMESFQDSPWLVEDDGFPDPDGWGGARDCAVSERIISGEPIGYCLRRRPEREDEGWESGWCFFADDDDDSRERMVFRSLGYICDLSPDIRRILDLPYGTAFMRGEDGMLHPYEGNDEEDR